MIIFDPHPMISKHLPCKGSPHSHVRCRVVEGQLEKNPYDGALDLFEFFEVSVSEDTWRAV